MASPSTVGKWLPRYELRVETAPGPSTVQNPSGVDTISITLPLTLDFEINRQFQAQAQTGNFKIKNLNPDDRDLLYKDWMKFLPQRFVQLRAGYPGFTPLIFNGWVQNAFSYRNAGETDTITELQCQDGVYQQSLGTPPAQGVPTVGGVSAATYSEILNNINSALPGSPPSAIIGNFPTTPVRGLALAGSTWDVIQTLANGQATIDNGQLKCMQQDEVFQNAQLPVLNSDSGLLGSPRISNSTIEADFLFEPRVTLGQLIELQSVTQRVFNGPYKVMGFVHRGTISGAMDGERITTMTFWKGTAPFVVIPGNAILQ